MKCVGARVGCLAKRMKRMRRNLRWRSLITLVNESYAILSVSILLNLQVLSFESNGLIAMSALCIASAAFFVLVPTAMISYLVVNFKRLY